MTHFIAIAAISENRAIGKEGKIPWYIPEDFKHFKETTLGHTIVMGRKTLESIWRILPWRKTILISKSFLFKHYPWSKVPIWDVWKSVEWEQVLPDWYIEWIASGSLEKFSDIYEMIEILQNGNEDKVYICWWGQIYREFLDRWIIDEIILSRVKMTIEWADAFFPEFEWDFILEKKDERESFTIEYWKRKV